MLEDPYAAMSCKQVGMVTSFLAHSKDRDEVYGFALRLRPKHSAIFCLAPMPEYIAINAMNTPFEAQMNILLRSQCACLGRQGDTFD